MVAAGRCVQSAGSSPYSSRRKPAFVTAVVGWSIAAADDSQNNDNQLSGLIVMFVCIAALASS